METEIRGDLAVYKNVRDFDLEQTFNCGQCFRWNREGDSFVGFAGSWLCRVSFEGGDMLVEKLRGEGDVQRFAAYMADYLSLNVDYSALKERFSEDETMKRAIAFAPGIRVLNQPFFETLITFIISRNNNIPRIKKIVDAMADTYGTSVGAYHAFPSRQQLKDVSVEDYSRLKMGFRAKYVYDAVQKVTGGVIKREEIEKMDLDSARKYLMQIKGVGPKVADCILLFSCKKYDSFPKDVWINRAMDRLFPNGLPRCVKGREGIAQQYIFHYARFNLEK